MKLHLTQISGANVVTGYGEGYVMINGRRHERNLVVLRDRLLTEWEALSFDELNAEHFAVIVELQPEIVLLGTGIGCAFRDRRSRARSSRRASGWK